MPSIPPQAVNLLKSFFSQGPVSSLKGLVRGTAGVMALPLVGETAYRTAQNLNNGKFQVGMPTSTGSVIATPLNWLSDITGISGTVSTLAHNAVKGVTEDPSFQDTLAKTQQATQGFNQGATSLSNAVDHLHSTLSSPEAQNAIGAGHAIASSINNIQDPGAQAQLIDVGTKAGIGAGKGILQGMGLSALKDPKNLAVATGLTLLPLVAYDLLNRKKRMQDKKLKLQLLQALRASKTQLEQQPVEKVGSAADILKRILYSNKKVPVSVIKDLLTEARGVKGLDAKKLQQIASQHGNDWSVFNNPFSRNPFKTIGLGTAGVGGGMLAYDKVMHAGANASPLDTASGFAQGAVEGPLNTLIAIESRALQNGRYNKIQGLLPTDKLTDIKKNVIEGVRTLKGIGEKTNNVVKDVMTPPPPEAPKTPVAPQAGTDAVQSPRGNWLHENIPYLAAAGALALPYVAYEGYKRFANKKEKKLEERTGNINTQLGLK